MAENIPLVFFIVLRWHRLFVVLWCHKRGALLTRVEINEGLRRFEFNAPSLGVFVKAVFTFFFNLSLDSHSLHSTCLCFGLRDKECFPKFHAIPLFMLTIFAHAVDVSCEPFLFLGEFFFPVIRHLLATFFKETVLLLSLCRQELRYRHCFPFYWFLVHAGLAEIQVLLGIE